MLAFALLALAPAVAAAAGDVDDDPGFGGAPDDSVAETVADEAADIAESTDDDYKSGDRPSVIVPPAPVIRAIEPPKKTAIELELERAKIDPARYPLIQLRVDVARAEMAVKEFEGRGLTQARDAEEHLAEAKGLLVDVERIAMHRMQVCLARQGIKSEVKNFRMTPGGAVRLTNQEMLAQASAIDPPSCARTDLIDQALVDRVRRAQELEHTLETVNFPYHRVAERRALEVELKKLKAELAKEDLPVITAVGAKDPFSR